jgi:hypothetical protein
MIGLCVVKFRCGKFGVRKFTWQGFKFLWASNHCWSSPKDYDFVNRCYFDDADEARRAMHVLCDRGKCVKEEK